MFRCLPLNFGATISSDRDGICIVLWIVENEVNVDDQDAILMLVRRKAI